MNRAETVALTESAVSVVAGAQQALRQAHGELEYLVGRVRLGKVSADHVAKLLRVYADMLSASSTRLHDISRDLRP